MKMLYAGWIDCLSVNTSVLKSSSSIAYAQIVINEIKNNKKKLWA